MGRGRQAGRSGQTWHEAGHPAAPDEEARDLASIRVRRLIAVDGGGPPLLAAAWAVVSDDVAKRLNVLVTVAGCASGRSWHARCLFFDAHSGVAARKTTMLRITRQPGAEHDTLLLEGSLLKEWIQELQQALALTRHAGAAVALDLSGLRFVDAEGTRYLRECRKSGVSLLAASPFVSALLNTPPPRWRPSRS